MPLLKRIRDNLLTLANGKWGREIEKKKINLHIYTRTHTYKSTREEKYSPAISPRGHLCNFNAYNLLFQFHGRHILRPSRFIVIMHVHTSTAIKYLNTLHTHLLTYLLTYLPTRIRRIYGDIFGIYKFTLRLAANIFEIYSRRHLAGSGLTSA